MSSVIAEAVKTLSSTVNVSTGLAHPNDLNKAKELFKILHEKGEILLKSDVESAALSHGWNVSSADELGSLAQQIGEGKSPRITGGPWWVEDIYEKIAARA
ncbi:DUF1889 family protein [Burkholderia sp. MR1-5-21]